ALRGAGLLTRLGEHREEDRGQDSNDRDHNEQFDQGERMASLHGDTLPFSPPLPARLGLLIHDLLPPLVGVVVAPPHVPVQVDVVVPAEVLAGVGGTLGVPFLPVVVPWPWVPVIGPVPHPPPTIPLLVDVL